MPALATSLTWATPVPVEVLGAHLEAYIELLPTINTLRLCHRFGRISHTSIPELPPELIALVEEILTTEARSRHLTAWKRDFACFELRCDPCDHLTKEQHDELLDHAFDSLDPSDYDSASEWCLEVDCHVDIRLCEDPDLWMDVHIDRSLSWEGRPGSMSALKRRGVFTTHAGLIRKHFGLEVWTSHIRTKNCPEDSYWAIIGDEPAKTTVAHLTLPDAANKSQQWDLTQGELEEPDIDAENGHAMLIKVPTPISKSEIARFKSMMTRLGLQPGPLKHAQNLMKGFHGRSTVEDVEEATEKHSNTVEKPSDENGNKENAGQHTEGRGAESGKIEQVLQWPQLMVLTQCAR